MKRATHNTSTTSRTDGGPAFWPAAAVLAFFIGIVYLPAANVPLIFDDLTGIIQNDSIKSLWPLVGTTQPGPLNPPPEHPTSGRPLVNLSFAINYWFGGMNPIGYHLVNIVIHFFNALLLWAITRRTLRLTYFGDRFVGSAEWLSLAVAALWALHPLQTEAVIYATQRTELMMAFFYLATLYCSLRYWTRLPPPSMYGSSDAPSENSQSPRARRGWLFLAIVACLCGMACKEVMVSAPLIVLLFERAFVAGTLKNCLRRSWPLYIGLASTLLLLAGLTVAGPRLDSAGFHLGIPPHVWWLTQSQILILYLKLVVWPWPLLIHYELPYVTKLADVWFFVLPLLIVGVLTLILLWKNRPLGFLGTCFFAILSPTFVIPVVTEMAAERRMYLALAPLVLIFVIGAYRLANVVLGKADGVAHSRRFSKQLVATGTPIVILTLIFCFASASRLAAYENELTLWLEVMHCATGESEGASLRRLFPGVARQYQRSDTTIPRGNSASSESGASTLSARRSCSTKRETTARRQLISPQRPVGCRRRMRTFHNSEAVALYMAGRNDRGDRSVPPSA